MQMSNARSFVRTAAKLQNVALTAAVTERIAGNLAGTVVFDRAHRSYRPVNDNEVTITDHVAAMVRAAHLRPIQPTIAREG